MAFLEIDGHRHLIPQGELTVGSDASAGIPLSGEGVQPQHLIVQGLPDGQVAVRLPKSGLDVKVNGVVLGPQPTPLLHGDKVEIAGHELRFVDERKSGSTSYVAAIDPNMLQQASRKAPAKRGPTGTTGGRLVSLTDGREYAVIGASLVIGRDAGCDVVVTSKSISRRHAEVMATPKGYVVVDSSTNGTFVNGQRIPGQQLLSRGDVIQCGEHEFRFYADMAPAPAAAPSPAAAPPAAPARPAAPAPPAAPVRASVPPPRKVPTPAPAARPAAPGAAARLSDTLHGVPGMAPGETGKRASALAYLVMRSGSLKGQRLPIKVPNVNIGRADYNDIVIPDDSVSTQHAKLQRREGIWVLVDLESTNGTLVDGEKLQGEVPIAPGAFIRFGTVSTMFEPTDDTVDPKKGSSTRVLGAIKLPQNKSPGTP